jgi:hypothetical protein
MARGALAAVARWKLRHYRDDGGPLAELRLPKAETAQTPVLNCYFRLSRFPTLYFGRAPGVSLLVKQALRDAGKRHRNKPEQRRNERGNHDITRGEVAFQPGLQAVPRSKRFLRPIPRPAGRAFVKIERIPMVAPATNPQKVVETFAA